MIEIPTGFSSLLNLVSRSIQVFFMYILAKTSAAVRYTANNVNRYKSYHTISVRDASITTVA